MITINPVNDAPIAQAGIDQYAFVDAVVIFDGSGSYDVDLDPLTYSWRMLSAPANSHVVLANTTASSLSFAADQQGDYRIALVVNDGLLNSVQDT